MKILRFFLFILSCAQLVAGPGASAMMVGGKPAAAVPIEWVTGRSGGATRNYAGPVGAKFYNSLNSTAVITHLGRWMHAGNSGSHVLYLASSTGTSLGNVTVNMSGATVGEFKYAELSPHITVSGWTDYYVMSVEANPGDIFIEYDQTITVVSTRFTSSAAGYATSEGASITQYGNANNAYGPVSFKYLP
jgi:hypothetical protein